MFFEIYASAAVFSKHIGGDVFKKFRASVLHHFYVDPNDPCTPLNETTFLTTEAEFIRPELKK